jgi:hypothetical protein
MKYDFTWSYVKTCLLLIIIPTIHAEGVSTWTVWSVWFPASEIVFWRSACVKSKWTLGDSNSLLMQNTLNYFFYSLPLLVTYIQLGSWVSCRCHSLPYLYFLRFKQSFGALGRAINTCMLRVLLSEESLRSSAGWIISQGTVLHCHLHPGQYIYEVHLLYPLQL